MMTWVIMAPFHVNLGQLPLIFLDADSRPAREQANDRYLGGWNPATGFTMDMLGTLHYEGDPPLPVLAEATLRDETIRLYAHDWVAITWFNGAKREFEVSRMD